DSTARRASCPAGTWSPAGVRRQRIHALTATARASCARPCGRFRPSPTGADGDPEEQRAPARRSEKSEQPASAARKAALLIVRVPFRWRRVRGGTARRGGAQGSKPPSGG